MAATPFYVSPEQLMKDRSDFARKGIARGRSVLAVSYTDGILFVAENPSTALHKVSEIYDRIAFAAVGKYNEFEMLRVAGVRLADMRGYAYDRRDVTGRALANAYAQTLGTIFTQESKPYEVEIVVAEVGDTPADDQMYRLTYDGSVGDERGFVAMGGQSDDLTRYLRDNHEPGMTLAEAMTVAVRALGGPDRRELPADTLEVAVLDRTRPRRKFKRLGDAQVQRLLPAADASAPAPDRPSGPDAAGGEAAPAGGPAAPAGGPETPAGEGGPA